VRALHAPDSEAALDAATHNEAEIRGVVQTFPAVTAQDSGVSENACSASETTNPAQSRSLPVKRSGADRPRTAASCRDSSFSRADRLHQIQQHLDAKRNGHTARQREIAGRVAEVTERDLDDLADDERCDEAVVIPQPCAAYEPEEPYDDVL
jgi:hypothetical protein